MSLVTALGVLVAAVWLYLLVARGGFWLTRERDDRQVLDPPNHWPGVVAVVPARNEADVIAHSIESLLRQDYPGSFRIVLVDDGSDDGTAAAALAVARSASLASSSASIRAASDSSSRISWISCAARNGRPTSRA